jgi:spermidine/putrescine transport system substrate-binding protein
MTFPEEPVKVLAPRSAAQRVSRRAFLAGSTVAMFSSSVLLAACGSEKPKAGGGSSGTGEIEDQLNFYNWDEYDDPELFKTFTEQLGPTVQIDTYPSNEAALAKLSTAAGTSGYDVVVPTGPFIPVMVENDLLEALDLSKIPNFKNLDPIYTNQDFDPGNKYSVCKDWGSTGWIIDKSKVSTPIATWQDFLDVAMGEAAGETSVLDAPNELLGLYCWANGIDWNTTDSSVYDAYEDFMVNQLAPNLKNFDSYSGVPTTQGRYALAQVWNGDARAGILGKNVDRSRFEWGLGAPDTELWMDNWSIVAGAQHPEAAYAWINFILDPENSIADLNYHGYNTGVNGVEQLAKDAGAEMLDAVFFLPDQVATMHNQEVNEMLDRQVDIYNKVKAAAGLA